jgi:hypothetical protein
VLVFSFSRQAGSHMEGEGCRVQLSVLSCGCRKWQLCCPRGGSNYRAAQSVTAQEQEQGEMFTAWWLELNWITLSKQRTSIYPV